MAAANSGCNHRWRKDQEELSCLYCGAMLYRNRGETGPPWIPPKQGDKPAHIKGDRRAGNHSNRKKWGTPDN